MKFRRRPSPLLLLLLPSLVSAISKTADTADISRAQPRAAKTDTATTVIDLNAKSKYEIGTKDAPVDGKDGKPHAGPWVGTEKDPKKKGEKTTKVDEELVIGKADPSKLVTSDGKKIPATNDGVMDDPHRQVPKQGTTGTEGGVSEKDKVRKAKEGQTGERVEKRPDSPKEAPPLPHDGKKVKSEKAKVKDVQAEDEDEGEGLSGLEVYLPLLRQNKH